MDPSPIPHGILVDYRPPPPGGWCPPVSFPPPGPFDTQCRELQWQDCIVKGISQSCCRISGNRCQDFLLGEGQREQTHFYMKRKAKLAKGTRFDYHCSFGPEDHSESLPNSEGAPAGKRVGKISQGFSVKRGCRASFVIVHFDNEVAEIRKGRMEHVNHGQNSREDGRHVTQPYLSKGIKAWVLDQLFFGISARKIVQMNKDKHIESYAHEKGISYTEAKHNILALDSTVRMPRDYSLTVKDVSNIQKGLDEADWKLDKDLATSLRLWTQENADKLLVYKERSTAGNEVTRELQLAFSTKAQVQLAVKYGKNRPFLIDSTFGTNSHKYPLFTVGVMDDQHNLLPVAWCVSGDESSLSIKLFLEGLLEACRSVDPSFSFGCALTDDSPAQQLAVSEAMPGVPILLCAFHAMQSLAKALQQKVPEKKELAAMSEELHQMIRINDLGPGEHSLSAMHRRIRIEINTFCQKHSQQHAFVEYFQQHWANRPEKWCQLFRNMPHCQQETTGALEAYHRILKLMIAEDGKKLLHARRIDQLLHLLVTTFQDYYLHKLYAKKAGFQTNPGLEKRVKDVCRHANQIKDSQVQLPEVPEGAAAVATVTNEKGIVYHVQKPGSADATCTCHYFARGEVCKHVMKVAYMMDSKVKEGHFIQHLALLRGTSRAGLAQLYARIQPAAGSELSEPTQSSIPPSRELPAAQLCEPAQGSSYEASKENQPPSIPRLHAARDSEAMAKQAVEEANARLQSRLNELKGGDGVNLSRLTRTTQTLLAAEEKLRKIQAEDRSAAAPHPGTQSLGPQALVTNPHAPAGNSLRRLRSCLERGRNRSRAPMRPMLNSAASPTKSPPEPLPAPAKKVPQPILQSAASRQTAHQARQAMVAYKRTAAKQQLRREKIAALSIDDLPQSRVQQAANPEIAGRQTVIGSAEAASVEPTSALQTTHHSSQQAATGPSNVDAPAVCPPLPHAQHCPQIPISEPARSEPVQRRKRSPGARACPAQEAGVQRQRRVPLRLADYDTER